MIITEGEDVGPGSLDFYKWPVVCVCVGGRQVLRSPGTFGE